MLKWLWGLIGGVPPEDAGGLMLRGKEARLVLYSGDVRALLRGIKDVLPPDAILYIEGPKDPLVIHLLEANRATTREKIQVGTLWPRAEFYHLPNDERVIEHLIGLAAHLAAPEVADHLVVYRGPQVLVAAYDLGNEQLSISHDLGEERYRRFLESIGGTEEER